MEIAGTLSKNWCKSLKLQKNKSQSENFNCWIARRTNYVGSSIQESLSKAPQCKQMQIDQNLKPTRPSLADGFATFVPATMTKAIFGKMGQYLYWDC